MTQMTKLFDRQGIPITTDEYEKAKRARRQKNIAAAHEVLERNHIRYQSYTGNWFNIEEGEHVVTYNPATGTWIDHGVDPIQRGYGIRNLVRYLRGEVN